MHSAATRCNILFNYLYSSLERACKPIWESIVFSIVLFGLLWLQSLTAFAQAGTATMNGTVQATTVKANTITGLNTNGILTVDGITYATVNDALAANPSFSGTINYPSPTLAIATDPLLNPASIVPGGGINVGFTTCIGTHDSNATVPVNNYVTVQVVEYDGVGNSNGAAATSAKALISNQCISVNPPVQLGASFTWGVFAAACTTLTLGQCSGPYFLQEDSTGLVIENSFANSVVFNFTTSSYPPSNPGACATSAGSLVPFECGATPVPFNPGLLMQNVRINLQGGNFSTAVPITVPANGALTGVARHATQIQMDPTFPKGIPCPMEPYGIPSPSAGGSLTANQQITVQFMYLDGAGGTLAPVCASMPTTLPPAPATCSASGSCQYQYLNPSPPLVTAPWHKSMRVWASLTGGVTGGSRIIECNGDALTNPCPNDPPSVWVMCGLAADGACGMHKNVSAMTGASFPFTTAGLCTSPGSTVQPDGDVLWLCVMKGADWQGTHHYPPGQEIWDPGTLAYWEALDTGFGLGCLTGSSVSFAGLGFAAVKADNQCHWMNIGPNIIVNGAFEILSQVCTTGKHCVNTTPGMKVVANPCAGSGRCNATSGIDYDFNGTTAVGNGSASHPTGTSTTTFTLSAAGTNGTGAIPLPAATLSDATCPTGFGGGSWNGTDTGYVHFLWVTPSGVIPPMAEASKVVSSGKCLKVSVSGITPPPDAVGWMPTEGTASLAEQVYPPDQQYALCDPAAGIPNFVPNLQHGAVCALGVDAYIVQEFPILEASTGRTIEPWMNTSETLISAVATPYQAAASGGRYFCRIENMEIELGRNLNVLEPNALAVFNNSCQEQSGVFGVQIDDAGQGDYYCLGNACQNNGGGDVHDAGQNSDYKQSFRFENNPSYRGLYGGTDSGPTGQTQWLSRNCVHYLGTDWSGSTGLGGTMFPAQGGEACIDTFEIDNASGVTIFAPYSSGQSVRSANNVVELGHFSWFNTVIGAQAGINSCPIMDWAQFYVNQSCTTANQQIAGTYSQENSVEILANDSPSITATSDTASIPLFSWFIPPSGQGTYSFHCSLIFSNSTPTDGLGIALQGNVTHALHMRGRALVDTSNSTNSNTTVQSGLSGDINTDTFPHVVILSSGDTGSNDQGATLDGSFQVGSGGTQFNINFYTQLGSTGLTIKANSECEIHGK